MGEAGVKPGRAGVSEQMSDWEYSDDDCPKCQATLATRRCSSFHTVGVCDECNNDGWVEWCRDCGWDVTFGCFLSPTYEAEWEQKQAKSVT